MKVSIERDVLLSGLRAVKGAVEKRSTMPILSSVLLAAFSTTGRIAMRATDLDIEISHSVVADVSAPGVVAVDVDKLQSFISKLPAGATVKLSADDSSIKVLCGRSRVTLFTQQSSEFPSISAGDATTHRFSIPLVDLGSLLGRAQFAISTEETRYYLNGIHMHVVDGDLRAVATDGHRLAMVKAAAPNGSEGMPGIIIPRKTVGEILKLCDGDGDATVNLSATKIIVSAMDVTITSKLIDGTFPDYERVIPRGNNKNAIMDRQSLVACASRIGTMADVGRGRAAKLSFSKGAMLLSVKNQGAGDAAEDIDAEYAGENLDVGFNLGYLSDIVGEMFGDKICFSMADPGAPTIITSPGDDSTLAVLMPMRV